MIPNSATLQNSALLVIDVINSCAAEDYEDPQRDIHYGRIRAMVPALAAFITAYRRLGGTTMLDLTYARGSWDTFRYNYNSTSRTDEQITTNTIMMTFSHRF